MPLTRRALMILSASLCGLALPATAADAMATLRQFVTTVQSGQGSFTQTVTSPDGKKVRKSSGTIEFQRPDRFRFAYKPPVQQLIVGDGRQVWLYDADLDQVTVRPMSNAIGATPAALLSGGNLDKDFALKNLPDAEGLQWVEALPKARDGQFQWVRIGWRSGQLAALEILDGFGQKSRLDFEGFNARAVMAPERFQFTPPKGADVLRQN